MLVVYHSDDPAQVAGVKDLEHRLVMRAIDMGGTCTGEHGIGTSKTQYLEVQLGKGAVGMMQTLKKALDPKGIMNPDKVVDMPVQWETPHACGGGGGGGGESRAFRIESLGHLMKTIQNIKDFIINSFQCISICMSGCSPVISLL